MVWGSVIEDASNLPDILQRVFEVASQGRRGGLIPSNCEQVQDL